MVEYKDKDGKVLYGFSQTQLDKTEKELRQVTVSLRILIILFIILLIGITAFMFWVAKNDIITRLIYGS